MSRQTHYQGERLSLKGDACTVRYVGRVAGKSGDWLGVEWDDPQRGKQNGTHEGEKYFECRSTSSTAASFLRPTQSWDTTRTLLEALTEKYMSTSIEESPHDAVYFSGKRAEEIGFTKFAQRQAKLQGIRVLVLDHMRIKQPNGFTVEEAQQIQRLCAEVTTLDLSGNLFESFDMVLGLCGQFPKLHSLTLDGNRFPIRENGNKDRLATVRSLSLSRTLLTQAELGHIRYNFPRLETLSFAENELRNFTCDMPYNSLTTLDLSNNRFEALADIQSLGNFCAILQTLNLQHGSISTVGRDAPATFPASLTTLSLAYNAISSWSFFNDLRTSVPSVRALRVTGNPLYSDLRSAEDKPLTTEDGHMLTIARLGPQLETLNYSKVSDKERLNAETYYLSQIVVELERAGEGAEEEVLRGHPRWKELCEEYGEPAMRRRMGSGKEEVDPRSLAARLATVDFRIASDIAPWKQPQTWRQEIPKSFDVYAVYGLVGRKLDVEPAMLEMALETDEQDPTARDSGYVEPEWWDSSDEEGEDGDGAIGTENWTRREVVLVPGTRALGTYVEGREATIRVRSVLK